MVTIWNIVPFCANKRLGHIHNEFIKLIPENDYVMINDPDVMMLHPHQMKWIEDILKVHGNDWDLFGCMTNRVGLEQQVVSTNMFEENRINVHMMHAEAIYNVYKDEIEETDLIAGFCMIFKKSLWNKIKFEESIQFDIKFCNAIKKAGGKIGIMKGIYIFHQYRLGQEDPKNYKKHLL